MNMIVIPKGSILKEVSPYAVVPLYNDNTRSDDTTATNCRVDTDPTRVPRLEDLPKWKTCQIWDRNQSNWILETSKMKKFLRRARRITSSSSDNIGASWDILCILTILRVVADNVYDEEKKNSYSQKQKFKNHQDSNDFVSTKQMSKNHSATHWWSPLVSEHYDDSKERKVIPKDDYEDESCSLLVELWPLIREYIPWVACQRLYHRIQNRLHILTIPHPLKTWAQKSVFELTNNEFEASWKIFQITGSKYKGEMSRKVVLSKEKMEKFVTATSSSPQNRLRTSKLWLDRVANIPERLVGVLIDDPLKILKEKQLTIVSTKSNIKKNIEISTALTLPRCHQSCLPNTCLELHVVTNVEKSPNVLVSATEKRKGNRRIFCKWIALYDLISAESENNNRTLATMPKSCECICFKCTYEKTPKICTVDEGEAIIIGERKQAYPLINSENLAQARRLAHSYFYKEAFRDAMSLYQHCYRYCASSSADTTVKDTTSTKFVENVEWKMYAEADLWYTMGAVMLSQQKFARAQQHWKNGSHHQRIHGEFSEQLEKQRAYQYFYPEPVDLVPKCTNQTTRPFKHYSLLNNNSPTHQHVFITSDVIEFSTCLKLINWAQEFASQNGGWSASRHYAVPTTDLPIHKVPKLLKWFQDWMPRVLLPILRDQFGTTRRGNGDERFYIHDAFLVRYEATASSCFLPLHFDESTHSCVLALNDNFDGGGSYIYNLDQSIAPATGGMISFLGSRCLHGGNPVTHGVRYILAIFLYLDKDLALDTAEKIKRNAQSSQSEAEVNKKRHKIGFEENETSNHFKKDDSLQLNDGGGFSFSFF